MKFIVFVTTAVLFFTPHAWLLTYEGATVYRDKAHSRAVSIPVLRTTLVQESRTTAAPVTTSGGGHYQIQRYANSCVYTAFANAAGIPLDVMEQRIVELYGEAAREGPVTAEMMIPIMAAFGYTVTATEAAPGLLPTIPRYSVFAIPRHAYNVIGYDSGSDTLTLFNPWSGAMEFRTTAEDAVMRRVGQPTENRPDELHYADVYIIR